MLYKICHLLIHEIYLQFPRPVLRCLANRCQVTVRSIPGPLARSSLKMLQRIPAPQLQHASAMCANVSWLIARGCQWAYVQLTGNRPSGIEQRIQTSNVVIASWLRCLAMRLCWAQRIPKNPVPEGIPKIMLAYDASRGRLGPANCF